MKHKTSGELKNGRHAKAPAVEISRRIIDEPQKANKAKAPAATAARTEE